jgi:DNA polymerase V
LKSESIVKPKSYNNVLSLLTMLKLEIYTEETGKKKIPMAGSSVSAGFPSPADDFLEKRLNISDLLIKNPDATFYARVQGTSMQDAGIEDGDILIVDKSISPKNGDIAVCFLDGEFTVKRIQIKKNEIWLVPANKNYPTVKISEDNDFIIWGIVTYTVKKHR